MQAVSHGNDSLCNGGTVRLAGDVPDKRLINLQLGEGKAFQVAEAGVAGTEVVHGKGGAQCLQLVQDGGCPVQILHDQTLGDLQLQVARLKSAFPQDPLNDPDKIFLAELARREINSNRYRLQAAILPTPVLPAGGFQNPLADRLNQPGFLGQRYETGG